MLRIKIFTTGGTIDKLYFDRPGQYQIGPSGVAALLAQARVGFDYEIVELMRKDSLQMTDADRELVRANILREPADKILVTHGTDTMAETARHVGTVPGKTIVFTGALQPAKFSDSDALFNVGLAIGALQSHVPGTYVAMNGLIFEGHRVVKNVDQQRFEPT